MTSLSFYSLSSLFLILCLSFSKVKVQWMLARLLGWEECDKMDLQRNYLSGPFSDGNNT